MALIGAVSLVAPMAAFAQTGQRPPAPSLAEMSASIGVSEAAVKACMPMPAQGQGQGQQAKGQPAKPDKPDASAIAACLTSAGESVSADQVEAALEKFAPPAPPKKS